MPGLRTRARPRGGRRRRTRAQFGWIQSRQSAARSQRAGGLERTAGQPGPVRRAEPVRLGPPAAVVQPAPVWHAEPVRLEPAACVQPGPIIGHVEPVRFEHTNVVEPDPVGRSWSDGPVDDGGLDRYVGVVGPGDRATAQECDLAEATGALLAARRTIVVTGGLGGVMAAAARGAQRAGGRTVGLLPGLDRVAAVESNSVVIPTGLGQLRNGLVVNSVDGVIAIGGSWGTLSELALARRVGRPVVSLRGWTILDQEGNPLDQDTADSPEQAVMRLLAQLRARSAPYKS